MTAGTPPYDTIAAFYDAEHRELEADVAYFARHGGSGRLLVLGCGTGRIGRILGPSREVVGIDQSEPMLAIARANAPHATYVQGDIRDFSLGQFAEIIVPNAVFNFLATRADQHRCLSCCAEALKPGGELVLDMPMPDFRLLGTPHTPEKLAWEGRVGGEEARRTREVRRFPVQQRLEITDRYYVGDELKATAVLLLRWVLPAEVEWMLEGCGFVVESMHGNYSGSSVGEVSPRLLVRAIRT